MSLTGFAWGEACPDRGLDFFETEGYLTRRAEISGFWLLRLAPVAMRDLEDKPFRLESMKRAQGALRQALIDAPALFDSPVGFSIVIPRVVDCEQKTLTIQFRLFTVKAPLGPIRNLMPNLGGIDISPIILLFALQAVQYFVLYYGTRLL